MIESKQLHSDGKGRITYLTKRFNQLNKKYSAEIAIRKGIQATEMSTQELREEYVADNQENVVKHRSMLDDFQL